MSVQEGIASRVAYKFYASGDMASNALPLLGTNPGATGAQILRRTSIGLSLGKNTFGSNENRSDRQTADMRYGRKLSSGPLNGELSCNTWDAFFAAVFRANWVPGSTLLPAAITSVASAAVDNSITLAGGTLATLGIYVGTVITLTGMTNASMNGKPFVVLGYTGRKMTVWPEVVDSAAAVGANIIINGASLNNPSTGFVKRKFALEVYNEDADYAQLFLENRAHGFNLSLPPEGMATIGFNATGRDMVPLEAAAAPYFTNPLPMPDTQVLAASNGLLQIGGKTIGILTGLELTADIPVEANAAAFQRFVPDVLLGRFGMNGTMTAYFENGDLYNYYLNETMPSLLAIMQGSDVYTDNIMTMFLPRIMITSSTIQTEGEGGVMSNIAFQTLKHPGSPTTGVPATTMQLVDSKWTA